MATELQQARLHSQRYEALAVRLRGEIWKARGSAQLERHREEWPALWKAIDALVEQVNENRPPYGVHGQRGLFDRD